MPPQMQWDLREVGWTKATDLAKVAHREGQRFDCAIWLHLDLSRHRKCNPAETTSRHLGCNPGNTQKRRHAAGKRRTIGVNAKQSGTQLQGCVHARDESPDRLPRSRFVSKLRRLRGNGANVLLDGKSVRE
jgi:hypothetical protein